MTEGLTLSIGASKENEENLASDTLTPDELDAWILAGKYDATSAALIHLAVALVAGKRTALQDTHTDSQDR